MKAIGIDIGGTKISIVVGNEKGRILGQQIIPTRTGKHVPQVLKQLKAVLDFLIAEHGRKSLAGIGVGIPGPVKAESGIVPRSPHLQGWAGLHLRQILEKETKLPVLLANDANAAALGEQYFGQGRNAHDFIYITVSTGIGGGVVVNGCLIEGAGGAAGEVGHTKIVPNGDRCKCGDKGCLEAYASGTAIADYAARELKRLKKSPEKYMKDGKIRAQLLGLSARKGDVFAQKAYERAGFFLGVGVANLLNILNPQKVILGGGVWKSAPPAFWKTMIKSCRENAWPQAFDSVKIVPSKLHGHAGDLGALALGFQAKK